MSLDPDIWGEKVFVKRIITDYVVLLILHSFYMALTTFKFFHLLDMILD